MYTLDIFVLRWYYLPYHCAQYTIFYYLIIILFLGPRGPAGPPGVGRKRKEKKNKKLRKVATWKWLLGKVYSTTLALHEFSASVSHQVTALTFHKMYSKLISLTTVLLALTVGNSFTILVRLKWANQYNNCKTRKKTHVKLLPRLPV